MSNLIRNTKHLMNSAFYGFIKITSTNDHDQTTDTHQPVN
jgi:hypothetical protein